MYFFQSNDDVDRVTERAEENDTEYLGGQTTQRLHQSNKESVEGVREVAGMVGHILHHLESLSHITLHLQVHED